MSGGASAGGKGTPSAGNIQGALHTPRLLGSIDDDRRRKKRKLRKLLPGEVDTLYVYRPVVNGKDIVAWAKQQGFVTTVQDDDLHVTIAYSKTPLAWPTLETDQVVVAAGNNRSIVEFDGGAVVLRLTSPELTCRWSELRNMGASWDYPDYHAHVTITWDKAGVNLRNVRPFTGPIVLGHEVASEIKEGWSDNIVEKVDEQSWSDAMIQKLGARHSRKDTDMIQAMHDHAVSLGAHCPESGGPSDDDVEKGLVRIAKVDEGLGMVFGYAVVCKVNGEPYYDLNVDLTGSHAGKRVPEHIPEDVMLKACVEFMQTARVGNEMHKEGTDGGVFVCAFPLTSDIAKAMGIKTNVTGLMVGFKPPAEMLAKFKDGTYKGFSIEGRRIAYEEHE